jgi:hypothetical protein
MECRQQIDAVLKEHEGHDMMHHEMVLVILFVTMFAQAALAWWKKTHPRSYQVGLKCVLH